MLVAMHCTAWWRLCWYGSNVGSDALQITSCVCGNTVAMLVVIMWCIKKAQRRTSYVGNCNALTKVNAAMHKWRHHRQRTDDNVKGGAPTTMKATTHPLRNHYQITGESVNGDAPTKVKAATHLRSNHHRRADRLTATSDATKRRNRSRI